MILTCGIEDISFSAALPCYRRLTAEQRLAIAVIRESIEQARGGNKEARNFLINQHNDLLFWSELFAPHERKVISICKRMANAL